MDVTRYLSRPKSLDAAFPWILALLAVGYVAYHWSNPVETVTDSGSYLDFNSLRTATYPIFLDLVTAVFGTVDAVAKAQLVIAAGTFAFLGWSLYRAFGSALFALAPVAALILHPQIASFHSAVMTESLFISLLCLLIGFSALTSSRDGLWGWTVSAALSCGLAITVRPAGVSLLIIWPVLFWLIWRRLDGRRVVLAVAVIAPIALCLIVENTLWHAYHESSSRPSLADRHLFAKALMVESEPSLSDPELARLAATGRLVTAPARELIADAPSHYAQVTLLSNFEGEVQWWRELDSEINEIERQRGISQSDVFAQVGRTAMLNAPLAWIGNALTHYFGLWSRAYVTPAIYEEYQTYIENAEPNPLVPNGFSRSADPLSPIQRLSSSLMATGLLISTLAVGLAAWQRLRHGDPDARLVVAAVCCLAIHTHLLTAGLFGIMATRYAVAMGPFLAVCGVLLASWTIEYARNAAAARFPALAAPRLGGGRSR